MTRERRAARRQPSALEPALPGAQSHSPRLPRRGHCAARARRSLRHRLGAGRRHRDRRLFGGGPGLPTLARIPVYGVPALVVVYGVISARLGAILAPGRGRRHRSPWSAALRQEDQAAIEKFAISALAPASRTHKVLALDGPDVTCDTACHRIIATSDTTLARKSRYSKDWVLFQARRSLRRRSAGDQRAGIPPRRPSRRLRGAHHRQGHRRRTGPARAIRCRSTRWMLALPARFNGIIYEISERIAGNERLLGRRIVGRLGRAVPVRDRRLRPPNGDDRPRPEDRRQGVSGDHDRHVERSPVRSVAAVVRRATGRDRALFRRELPWCAGITRPRRSAA